MPESRRWWSTLSRRVARMQDVVLLTLVYWTAVPLVRLLQKGDPLGLTRQKKESYWEPHQPLPDSLSRHTHPF